MLRGETFLAPMLWERSSADTAICGNRLIVHAAANAQRAVDLILGSIFEEENETTENVGDAAVSGIPAAVAMNIASAVYGHTHL